MTHYLPFWIERERKKEIHKCLYIHDEAPKWRNIIILYITILNCLVVQCTRFRIFKNSIK